MVVKPALCRYKFLVHTSFPQTTATLCALNKKKRKRQKGWRYASTLCYKYCVSLAVRDYIVDCGFSVEN